jgi:hypothetical protein
MRQNVRPTQLTDKATLARGDGRAAVAKWQGWLNDWIKASVSEL